MGSVSSVTATIDTQNKVDNYNSIEVDVDLDINTTNKGDEAARSLLVVLGYNWISRDVEEYVTYFLLGIGVNGLGRPDIPC